jgi:hypothetical protein
MDAKRNRWLTNAFVAIFSVGFLLLSACGGGGSSSPPPPPPGTTAPSGLSYQTPQAFTVGQAITALNPTVTGTVSSYLVNPALPAGLAVSATTGVISGTPTAITAQAKYTVTASNSGGSTTADITIAVNDVMPSSVSYPSATVALATGVAITPLTPSTAAGGGAIVSWSISPDLPAGLSFKITDGSISGTPTAASAATTYTISAKNSGGQSTFALSLSVQSGALLDLGHNDAIKVLRFDGTRVLSVDIRGHWVLWNYATGASIASGDAACDPAFPCANDFLADFAGQVIAIQTPTGFEMRSSVDGHVVSTITTTATADMWWKLATDGSYVVVGNSAGLKVWSSAGVALLTKPGTYYRGLIFAAAGQMRSVPATQNIVETTSVSTGVSTNTPFNGAFQRWFADGNRFLTWASPNLLTYSAAGVQEDITTVLPAGTLLATGNWFSTYVGTSLSLYKVGASSSPAVTYNLDAGSVLTASGTLFIAQSPNLAQVTVIDLSGATPVKVDQPTPISGGVAYAAVSASQWIYGNSYGVLFDGASSVATPRYLDYGEALSIAGSTARFAIATASGRILHYDAATKTLEGTIQDFSAKVALSADGAVLAALGDTQGGGIPPYDLKAKVYSLPGEGVISTWPSNASDPTPANISLSASGTVLGQVFADLTARADPVTGGGAIWTNAGPCAAVRLSSDGTHIACPASAGQPGTGSSFNTSNATQIFNNGVLTTGLSGIAVGWVDDAHLLVNGFKLDHTGFVPQYNGASIYGPTGNLISAAAIPEIHEMQPLTADTIYAPGLNSILKVSDGTTIWTSADGTRGIGAVVGGNVVFVSGAQVYALPR